SRGVSSLPHCFVSVFRSVFLAFALLALACLTLPPAPLLSKSAFVDPVNQHSGIIRRRHLNGGECDSEGFGRTSAASQLVSRASSVFLPV
ncbi:hypothetical protein, partial [Virgisporangium aliadipatigenens]|uniref:hypothetical protein n=1 Tax=Virgisporangium aliadipatigenens TaxID=741659 RepID=UPI0019421BBE